MNKSHVTIPQRAGVVLHSLGWNLIEATVIERPNRFLVIAELNRTKVRCHIHDPGRLKELIYPGNSIKIRQKTGPKTDYSVVCAYYNGEWILLDSRLHPILARKFLPMSAISEVKIGNRRIDFMCENEYIEVKGCTLVDGKVALFPDAPSIRAAEHVRLLSELVSKGFSCSILILVLRKSPECFRPNTETDPQFADNFIKAVSAGVNIFMPRLYFDGESVVFNGLINLCKDVL